MSTSAREDKPTCPSGQNYYICLTASYVGCCSHDPCQSGMCDNAGGGTCVPVTLTVTETVFTGTASSTAATGLGGHNDANNGVNPSIGSATLAAGTNINDSSSIAQDTTLRVTATATNTLFTTNTVLSSSSNSAEKVSNAKASPTTSPHPTSTSNPSTSHTSHTGAIAGSVIGSLAGLALLSLLLLCCCRHRNKLKLKFKRKGSDASELDEKAKELAVREVALAEAEKRKSNAPQFVGPASAARGFVIDGGMASPTGTGESGTRLAVGDAGGGSGMRRRSQDAREQVGRWI